jgi:hypothetical protein
MDDFINEKPEKEYNQEHEKNDSQKQNSSTKKDEQKNHIIEIMHSDEELELYN